MEAVCPPRVRDRRLCAKKAASSKRSLVLALLQSFQSGLALHAPSGERVIPTIIDQGGFVSARGMRSEASLDERVELG